MAISLGRTFENSSVDAHDMAGKFSSRVKQQSVAAKNQQKTVPHAALVKVKVSTNR
jgi:hypothetical protein